MNLERALDILKDKGYKYTGKRKRLLDIFLVEGRYLSAKEILEAMQEAYPDLSFDTIYRNLSLFETLEIIEGTEWDGERKYRLHCDGQTHHHHLICTRCGITKTIHACPMDTVIEQPSDFHITGHKFEVYGRCTTCLEV
ncbi:transcriptional repressor [Hazenella sp. IB182357]|uniref:Transcriptional repressor n=1 Tax=Polycladospora coralii TaxID=2771432 RepID=A0A926NAH8_9BACL|nr:Fur family transcriptional regulator [Polycladospora coralii]MBD1372040.1 transcriptional repressor [Polycladospora coralii]MBS7530546.1 transcriptional repressor [Polycladospora coralii]